MKNQILQFQEDFNLSQKDAAIILGIPKSTLQNWVLEGKGKRGISRLALRLIQLIRLNPKKHIKFLSDNTLP